MCDLCNLFYIWDNTVIRRWSDQYRLYLRILSQTSFHFVRKNSAVYPPLTVHLWINIGRFQISKIDGMIHCFVAVSCNKDLSIPRNRRWDCRKKCCGTSINTVKALSGPIQFRHILLCLQKKVFRMMEIIKAFYLSDISFKRELPSDRCGISFVPRHVKRIVISAAVFF